MTSVREKTIGAAAPTDDLARAAEEGVLGELLEEPRKSISHPRQPSTPDDRHSGRCGSAAAPSAPWVERSDSRLAPVKNIGSLGHSGSTASRSPPRCRRESARSCAATRARAARWEWALEREANAATRSFDVACCSSMSKIGRHGSSSCRCFERLSSLQSRLHHRLRVRKATGTACAVTSWKSRWISSTRSASDNVCFSSMNRRSAAQ